MNTTLMQVVMGKKGYLEFAPSFSSKEAVFYKPAGAEDAQRMELGGFCEVKEAFSNLGRKNDSRGVPIKNIYMRVVHKVQITDAEYLPTDETWRITGLCEDGISRIYSPAVGKTAVYVEKDVACLVVRSPFSGDVVKPCILDSVALADLKVGVCRPTWALGILRGLQGQQKAA